MTIGSVDCVRRFWGRSISGDVGIVATFTEGDGAARGTLSCSKRTQEPFVKKTTFGPTCGRPSATAKPRSMAKAWTPSLFAGFACIASVAGFGCKKDTASAIAVIDGGVGSSMAAEKAGPPDLETLAYAKKQLEISYAGTDREPPTSAPKPEPGKKVWIISPGRRERAPRSLPTPPKRRERRSVGR